MNKPLLIRAGVVPFLLESLLLESLKRHDASASAEGGALSRHVAAAIASEVRTG